MCSAYFARMFIFCAHLVHPLLGLYMYMCITIILGDYVVMVPIREGNKVQGEIVYILLAKQIKYLKDENLW